MSDRRLLRTDDDQFGEAERAGVNPYARADYAGHTPVVAEGSPRKVSITSFGFLHQEDGRAPTADFVADLRDLFYDPHRDESLKYMDGRSDLVKAAVRNTPGVMVFKIDWVLMLKHLFEATAGNSADDITVAIGCAGGRHRSVVVADDIADSLASHGIPVGVAHRDIDKPVEERGRER